MPYSKNGMIYALFIEVYI